MIDGRVEPAPPPPPTRVLPLGDSITEGVPGAVGYRRVLAAELARAGLRVRLVGTRSSAVGAHEGWSGFTTEDLERRLEEALPRCQADWVLLHIGSNDIGLGLGAPHALAGTRRVLDMLLRHAPRARVLLAQIIPMALLGAPFEAEVRALNAALPALAAERRARGQAVDVVDLHGALDLGCDMHDLIHPNAEGYRKLGEAWARALLAHRRSGA